MGDCIKKYRLFIDIYDNPFTRSKKAIPVGPSNNDRDVQDRRDRTQDAARDQPVIGGRCIHTR